MKISELRFGDIVELRNGNLIKLEENNIIYYQDIVKVYRLKQEKKQEILTEKEKLYICNLIKPFLDKVNRIVKREYYDEEFIFIIIKDDTNITLPNFEKGKYYKNMKLRKEYTLEELGLIDYKKEK